MTRSGDIPLDAPGSDVELMLGLDATVGAEASGTVERVCWPRAIVTGIAGFVLLWVVLPTPMCGRPKRVGRTEAVNNLRQIGLGVDEFYREYHRYPGEETIQEVHRRGAQDWQLGTKTSNDYFRQLLASGVMSGENVFHAKIKGAVKPDGIFTAAKALEKGECAFAYFPGARAGDSPDRPLAAVPVIPRTNRFDPKPFDGKAVVLFRDGSVRSLVINKQGNAVFKGATLLMDPANPAWDGREPVIAWPE